MERLKPPEMAVNPDIFQIKQAKFGNFIRFYLLKNFGYLRAFVEFQKRQIVSEFYNG